MRKGNDGGEKPRGVQRRKEENREGCVEDCGCRYSKYTSYAYKLIKH